MRPSLPAVRHGASLCIDCITTGPDDDPFRWVSHVGGRLSDGRRFRFTLADAVAGIRQGDWTFHLLDGGGEAVAVEVAERGGLSYLKTARDKAFPDLLVAMPECRC
jgi:hypothetical protein